MNEYLCRGLTLPIAYHKALLALQDAPVIPCPDWNTNQKEVSMTLVVDEPLRDNMISRLFFGDPVSLEQYRQEMLDGILDFEVARGNWTYTYHARYANQYQFILDELRRDPWSRRAVMDIRTLDDMGSPDPACWQHVQYFLRDGALHSKVLFRSNDACKATFMNAFALIELQKRIADALGVEPGVYVHRANSFHAYERDYEDLENYCRHIENDPIEKLTYKYAGGWDRRMERAKPAIEEKVKNLRAARLGES